LNCWGSIEIDQAGYVYVYLSNESSGANYVYFDNMNITVNESRIMEKSDYYPFGLTFNSYDKAGMIGQNFKYNKGTGEIQFKTERIEDLGLDWDMTKFRTYDYALGRFLQVDPKADQANQEGLTPYQYAFNNPIRYNDPNGDCPFCTFLFAGIKGAIVEYAGQVTGNLVKNGGDIKDALTNNIDVADIGTAFVVDAVTLGAGRTAETIIKTAAEIGKAGLDVNIKDWNVVTKTVVDGSKSKTDAVVDLVSSAASTKIDGSITKEAVGSTQKVVGKVVEKGLNQLTNVVKEPVKKALKQ
jgi:RHS repeat-associated protein